MQLLIAEDDVHVAKVIVELLKRGGDPVELVETAREAIDTQVQPKMVLTDIGLRDGSEAGFQVVEHFVSLGIPVMVISGHPEYEERALRLGAKAFLAKPFGCDKLIETIVRICFDHSIALGTRP